MRVLLINTSERIGGAAIAASRLHESLKNNGIKAKLLVRDKQTGQISVVTVGRDWLRLWKFMWERLVIWMHNRFQRTNLFAVDIANTGTDITSLPEFRQADIIHLHWINQGMLSLSDIRKILASGKPVVWTLHDMWPITGICHHARECDHFHNQCGNCFYLYGNGSKKDLSARVFHKKSLIYKTAPICFVACSRWLESQALKSALVKEQRLTSIPNPINTNLFRPRNKKQAREKCGLPTDKKLIMFGSFKITDKRKGIDYLIEATRILIEKHPELQKNLAVVVMGNKAKDVEHMLPFDVYPVSYISREKELVNVYNAVDLFVTPSLEENLPNTIMEAMACGVPCVGFQVGGVPEMIDHLHNGYVAKYKSAEDFANGIYWALTEPDYKTISEEACRKAHSAYSERNIAKKYIEVYNQITGKHA